MEGIEKREAGYALLDSIIALALITIALWSTGLLVRSALNRGTMLHEHTVDLTTARNTIAEGRE